MPNKKEKIKVEEGEIVTIKSVQPIVITTPTYDVQGLWISIFGNKVVVNYPDDTKVKQAWEDFGRILGAAKAKKIQYETAGLTESSKKLDEEISKRSKELEKRTLEIIGYPKLASYVVTNLRSEAQKIGKYLNQYSIEKYPHLPPSICVEAMQKAKPFFNSFEVWAIEDVELKPEEASTAFKAERAFNDPVIIGCKEVGKETFGNPPRPVFERYFIASWGDDIPLEQVLGNAKEIEN